ncbi:FixH family protein [Pseudomonadota bacterium]
MNDNQIRPWYREPWPWVAIGIPLAAVIMGMTTLYLAIANPDYLVVDDQQYNEIKAEFRAQDPSEAAPTESENSGDPDDGAH